MKICAMSEGSLQKSFASDCCEMLSIFSYSSSVYSIRVQFDWVSAHALLMTERDLGLLQEPSCHSQDCMQQCNSCNSAVPETAIVHGSKVTLYPNLLSSAC